jgi:hypothetical protein
MDEQELQDKLIAGWEWLKRAPDGDEKNDFYDRWLVKLGEYTESFGFIGAKRLEGKLPKESPWIEELREQLTLGGTADVERKRIDRRTGA